MVMELIYTITNEDPPHNILYKDEPPICALSNQNIIAISSHEFNLHSKLVTKNQNKSDKLV